MIAAKAVIAVALASIVLFSWAADDTGVTPYRPSISNPAQLPTPGQLEVEFGGLHTKTGNARDESLPYLLKLGFSKEWGILIGGEAYVWSRDEDGSREHGVGDTSFILKRAFILNSKTAFGLELDAKVPTAKEAIGSGKTEYTLNGIYSQDIGSVHLDANLNTTRVGVVEPGTARMQTGLSAAFSMPLTKGWRGVTELSGTRRSGTPTTAQLLAAVVYNPSKWYSIDVGMAKGLTRKSQDWSIFSGFVVPIAKLW
ncbi:transporter [Noviherbaspirillum pedocola]|uniref:transporter n=1 Tax=Noviherbaspirillum pedocola TaxID=2801341 RepID=UPI001F3AC331|nr:transporter [Noviherbaspirillum pedocola]